MRFKFLVVDDEPLARKLITSHMAKIELFECVAECANAMEANSYVRKGSIDILFLDIQMPEMDGLKFISTLKNPPAVILTTAFRNYAPEAFDFDVVDYLLKPISFERLLKATNRFLDRRSNSPLMPKESTEGSFIYVKADRKMHKVPVEEIMYVESLDEYIKVHTKAKVLVSRENITTMEQKLTGKNFVRVHRSFIVSAAYVKAISAEGIEVAGALIPIGRAFKHAALAALGVSRDLSY